MTSLTESEREARKKVAAAVEAEARQKVASAPPAICLRYRPEDVPQRGSVEIVDGVRYVVQSYSIMTGLGRRPADWIATLQMEIQE